MQDKHAAPQGKHAAPITETLLPLLAVEMMACDSRQKHLTWTYGFLIQTSVHIIWFTSVGKTNINKLWDSPLNCCPLCQRAFPLWWIGLFWWRWDDVGYHMKAWNGVFRDLLTVTKFLQGAEKTEKVNH